LRVPDLTDLDDIVEARYAAKRIPKDPGWKPGVDTERGQLVLGGPDRERPTAADWRIVLERAGLDPDAFEVLEPVDVRSWDAAVGEGRVETLVYYKAKIISREDADDLTGFAEHVRSRNRAGKRPRRKAGPPCTYVVAISDPQIGKEHIPTTAARIVSILEQIEDDVRRLRDEGHNITDFLIVWGGDGCEGVTGFYSSQETTVKGGYRRQIIAAADVAFEASTWSRRAEGGSSSARRTTARCDTAAKRSPTPAPTTSTSSSVTSSSGPSEATAASRTSTSSTQDPTRTATWRSPSTATG
jgi:hypothetical protein